MIQPSRNRSPVGFVEVPDFHVAVVRLARPELADRSIIVGGDPEKKGKVLEMTPDLRGLGIESGMLVQEALTRCPTAVWIETDMTIARDISGRLRAAVRHEVEALEVDGLSAFYFEAPADLEEAIQLADRLRISVQEQTALPIRVGVAPARFASRMAAQEPGDTASSIIQGDEFEAFLERQPLERFPGVGPKTAARLAELGAPDVPGVRRLGQERLEILLGNHGRGLWLLATGQDPKPLRVRRHPASLSRERSLETGTQRPEVLLAGLQKLSESLSAALLREGLVAGRIALRLTFEAARPVTRSRTFTTPVVGSGELLEAAGELLARVDLADGKIRKLALVLAGLDLKGAEDRQLDLF